MPIVSINFSQSQENINKIGLRSWKKFGAEYQLMEGENLEDAKKALKSFVYESLKKQPEELPEETTIQLKEPDIIQKSQEEQYIEAIESCNNIKFLKLYESHTNKFPAVKEAYDKKFAELNSK